MAKRRVVRSVVAVALVAGVVAATGGVDSAVSATQMSSPDRKFNEPARCCRWRDCRGYY